MARAEMQNLIERLRNMTEASRTDTFQGKTYWSDDQLEEVLDENRVTTPVRLSLVPGKQNIGGSPAWYIQAVDFSRHIGYEDNFKVYTGAGVEVAAEDFVVEKFGTKLQVTFDPDEVSDTSYELEITLYNLNWAAAEVWGRKADQRIELVDMKAGAHQFKGNQEYQRCLDRQIYYRKKSARVFDLPNKRRFVTSVTYRSRR